MRRTGRANGSERNEDIVAADLLVRLVDRSFDMETTRAESLGRQTSMLIACISIVSVALATVFAALVSVGCDRALAYFFALNATALLVGFCSCVVAMFRKPYKVLAGPKSLRLKADEKYSKMKSDGVSENAEDLLWAEYLAARDYADSLAGPYDSLFVKNEFIRRANKVALACLFASCGISFASLIYAFIGV